MKQCKYIGEKTKSLMMVTIIVMMGIGLLYCIYNM